MQYRITQKIEVEMPLIANSLKDARAIYEVEKNKLAIAALKKSPGGLLRSAKVSKMVGDPVIEDVTQYPDKIESVWLGETLKDSGDIINVVLRQKVLKKDKIILQLIWGFNNPHDTDCSVKSSRLLVLKGASDLGQIVAFDDLHLRIKNYINDYLKECLDAEN
jgi:hypothetical protein